MSHIKADSPAAARSFASAVIQASRSLSEFSERGRIVSEVGEPMIRELLMGRYRMIYEVFPDRVAIVRVIHASRDFETAWRGTP